MNHSFDVEIASEIGLRESIILQHLLFWVKRNAANNKNSHDGRTWTYNSRKAFQEIFPYISDKSMRTTLTNLEKNGYIETGNFNKMAFDRTLWYAVTKKTLTLFKTTICPIGKSKSPIGKSIRQNGQPIPDINTDLNHIQEDKNLCAKESVSHLTKKKEVDGLKEEAQRDDNPASSAKPKSGGAGNYSAEFEEWWQPWVDMKRNIAKPKCFEKWKIVTNKKNLLNCVYSSHLIKTIKQQKTWYIESGFIPLPITYLNQGRWEDTKEAILFNRKNKQKEFTSTASKILASQDV